MNIENNKNKLQLKEENQKFFKLMLAIAPPVIMQEVLNSTVNVADTLMIGRGMGIVEVAAVGLANQVTFLFMLMVFGVMSGSNVFNGQYHGKGEIENIHKVMGIGFIGTFVIAMLMFLPAMFLPRQVMFIFSRDELVIEAGVAFLRIIAWSFFLNGFTITRSSAMRSMQQTKIPMIGTVVALSVNVIANYLSLFVFGWGLIGVAYGTLLSRVVELVLQEILIRAYKVPVRAKVRAYFSFDLAFVKNFFNIGIFILMNEIAWAVGMTSYNVAYGLIGTNAQGAIQIVNSIMMLFGVFGNSVAISTGIIISNTLGAKSNALAIRFSRKCITFALWVSVVMGALLIIFSNPLIGFYQLEPVVSRYARNTLIVGGVILAIRTVNFVSIVGILRSGGEGKWCFKIEMGTIYLIGVPLAFIGAWLGFPIYVVFMLVNIEELVKLIISLRRVFTDVWARTIV